MRTRTILALAGILAVTLTVVGLAENAAAAPAAVTATADQSLPSVFSAPGCRDMRYRELRDHGYSTDKAGLAKLRALGCYDHIYDQLVSAYFQRHGVPVAYETYDVARVA